MHITKSIQITMLATSLPLILSCGGPNTSDEPTPDPIHPATTYKINSDQEIATATQNADGSLTFQTQSGETYNVVHSAGYSNGGISAGGTFNGFRSSDITGTFLDKYSDKKVQAYGAYYVFDGNSNDYAGILITQSGSWSYSNGGFINPPGPNAYAYISAEDLKTQFPETDFSSINNGNLTISDISYMIRYSDIGDADDFGNLPTPKTYTSSNNRGEITITPDGKITGDFGDLTVNGMMNGTNIENGTSSFKTMSGDAQGFIGLNGTDYSTLGVATGRDEDGLVYAGAWGGNGALE